MKPGKQNTMRCGVYICNKTSYIYGVVSENVSNICGDSLCDFTLPFTRRAKSKKVNSKLLYIDEQKAAKKMCCK